MTHSKFPWTTHPHTPTAVFDGDGRRIIDQWMAPDRWLPIETAPKECGVPINVWCRDDERVPNVCCVCWIGNAWREWGMNDFGTMAWIKLEYEPTHWMPIPNAPAVTPTPLDPETAAANAVMIAGLPALIEALEPFAKLAQLAHEGHRDTRPIVHGFDIVISQRLTIGDLRRAAAVLASIGRTL